MKKTSFELLKAIDETFNELYGLSKEEFDRRLQEVYNEYNCPVCNRKWKDEQTNILKDS